MATMVADQRAAVGPQADGLWRDRKIFLATVGVQQLQETYPCPFLQESAGQIRDGYAVQRQSITAKSSACPHDVPWILTAKTRNCQHMVVPHVRARDHQPGRVAAVQRKGLSSFDHLLS